jgi:hypothetical protein
LLSHWPEPLLDWHDFSETNEAEKHVDNWWENCHRKTYKLEGTERPCGISLLRVNSKRFGFAIRCTIQPPTTIYLSPRSSFTFAVFTTSGKW